MEKIINKINPQVTWCPISKAFKGTKTKIVKLYDVMSYCKTAISPDAEKASKGSISAYKSETSNPPYEAIVFEGVVFVDIDNLSLVSPTASEEIFNSFDKLCGCMPNLLAMNYSHSKNLHLFFYDEDIITDPSLYKKKALLYLMATAASIRKCFDIDLRQYDGALDTHNTSAYQKFFLCHSDFQWNIYCTKTTISKADEKKLQSEYHILYKKYKGITQVTNIPEIELTGKGDVQVDKNYQILGYTGYEARTRIVAAAYFHFREDLESSIQWISSQFANAKEMNNQLISMVRNNKVASMYNRDVDDFLFGHLPGQTYRLGEGQFISDVIDIDTLSGKYFYICSNTGTGKTEFVKSFIKKTSGKAIIIQITKALRDGKSQGIENITYGNWDSIIDRSKIHTTIEGAIRNCVGMDLSRYTVVVDESHLLEEYINVRRNITQELISLLESAGKVVFMSATPKSDINLFDFTKMTFEKIQPQDLKIYHHPMRFSGKGSKEASEYGYIINYIKSEIDREEERFMIFSNKKQECWKKYGLENEDVTYFNSNNISDPKVQSILKYNLLTTPITLSTKYMGCGVEIKKEREVHIVFNLNEGFDFDFIVQSIGRPRSSGGVERVILHLFYTEDKGWAHTVDRTTIDGLDEAFKNLVVDANDNEVINILAAKMLNIYDPHFNHYSVKDKIQCLWMGNYVNERIYCNPNTVSLFKRLPYRNIDIEILPTINIDMDGKMRRIRKETELIDYLQSLKGWEINRLGEDGYEKLFSSGEIPYNDSVNARKVIQNAKVIVRYMELDEAMNFFNDVRKAADTLGMLVRYAKVQAGIYSVQEFAGSEAAKEKLEMEFNQVRKIFTDEFIQLIIDDTTGWKARVADSDIYIDDVFAALLDVEMEVKPPMIKFNAATYEECIKKDENTAQSRRLGGKIGTPKKKIKVRRESDGEVFEFDSKGECMKWLGWGSQRFSKFVKNQADKKSGYTIID